VGSVLVGRKEEIHKARRVRKRLGGGMRQAGILAAACHYALDHHVERLHEDHERAARLGQALRELPYVAEVMPVVTNIVIVTLAGARKADAFLALLREQGVLAAAFGPNMARFVLHHDVDDVALEKAIHTLRKLVP
jgi:threonine aldolase